MADIDIQPKKKPIWPWIVGIIVAIIIIWVIVESLDKNDDNVNDNDEMYEDNDTTGQLQEMPSNTIILTFNNYARA